MKHRLIALAALLSLSVTACATGVRAPESRSSSWRGDARLYRILMPYPIGAAQHDSIRVYAAAHGSATNDLLADAAEDQNAPAVVRINALFVLAQRGAGTHLGVFRNALDDEDVRVRATATAAMREFMHTHPFESVRIARMALSDSAPEVQAQALQVLGDNDIGLLREYVATAQQPELRGVARDLVRLAEERGAPLLGDTVTGALRREAASGHTLTFTPRTFWPQWHAAVGTVRIESADAPAVVLENIEAVGSVVPVFFSPDGTQIVFERDRQIVVRSLQSGSERVVGTGIAPRLRPFTDEFVFLRELVSERSEQRHLTQARYEVLSASFADAAPAPTAIGGTTMVISFERLGAYSPARTARVEERGGSFYLTGEGMEIFNLPDPFGG